MTSLHERANGRPSVRPSVQTLGEGKERLKMTRTWELKRPSFLSGIQEKRIHFYLLCQQTVAEVDLKFSR